MVEVVRSIQKKKTPVRPSYTGPTFKDQIKPPPSPKPPVRVVYIATKDGRSIPS